MTEMTPEAIEAAMREKGLKDYLASNLREGKERMDKIDSNLEELRSEVESMKDDVRIIREVLLAGKGFFRTAGWIANAFKWVGGMAVAALALFGLWEKFK